MVGRSLLLLKENKISKQDFDKCVYIITKLNNHLISKIENLNSLISSGNKTVPFQPTEFLSFEFVEREPEPVVGDIDLLDNFKNNEYKVLENFHFFIIIFLMTD